MWFKIVFHFIHFSGETRRERLVYELCAFFKQVSTWTLHPFKYLDNYNILEGEEYAYFDKTY